MKKEVGIKVALALFLCIILPGLGFHFFLTPATDAQIHIVTTDEITVSGRTLDSSGFYTTPDSVRIVVYRDGVEEHDAWYNSADDQCAAINDMLVFTDAFGDIDDDAGDGLYEVMAGFFEDDGDLYLWKSLWVYIGVDMGDLATIETATTASLDDSLGLLKQWGLVMLDDSLGALKQWGLVILDDSLGNAKNAVLIGLDDSLGVGKLALLSTLPTVASNVSTIVGYTNGDGANGIDAYIVPTYTIVNAHLDDSLAVLKNIGAVSLDDSLGALKALATALSVSLDDSLGALKALATAISTALDDSLGEMKNSALTNLDATVSSRFANTDSLGNALNTLLTNLDATVSSRYANTDSLGNTLHTILTNLDVVLSTRYANNDSLGNALHTLLTNLDAAISSRFANNDSLGGALSAVLISLDDSLGNTKNTALTNLDATISSRYANTDSLGGALNAILTNLDATVSSRYANTDSLGGALHSILILVDDSLGNTKNRVLTNLDATVSSRFANTDSLGAALHDILVLVDDSLGNAKNKLVLVYDIASVLLDDSLGAAKNAAIATRDTIQAHAPHGDDWSGSGAAGADTSDIKALLQHNWDSDTDGEFSVETSTGGDSSVMKKMIQNNWDTDTDGALMAELAGEGPRTVNLYTKNAADSVAISGFTIDVYDSSSGEYKGSKTTNSNGLAVFSLDDETYTIHLTKTPWTITSPRYLTVSANVESTYYATAFDPGSPASADMCRIYINDVRNLQAGEVAGCKLLAEIPSKYQPVTVGEAIRIPSRVGATSDESGYVYIDVYRSAGLTAGDGTSTVKYDLIFQDPQGHTIAIRQDVEIPDQASWEIDWTP